MEYKDKIIVVGAGVAGANAITKLIDNGYPGELITVIDRGRDPYNRKPEEIMKGWLGAGGWSDGKLTYHTSIGGQLSKYCGRDKAYDLMNQVIENFKRFHPQPENIYLSDPKEQPEWVKPYFSLRLYPTWHIGTDYLSEIGKNWYEYLVEKGVNFLWRTKVNSINFQEQKVFYEDRDNRIIFHNFQPWLEYDKLIFAAGKSGIEFAQELINQYNLPTEPKSVQIGVRFEAPQKHFQKIIDISYDFKLYKKIDNSGVSLRSFCTNNNAAYVAVEKTYGDVSYNGHAKKGEEFYNSMTNFGILMEIQDIENPFEWSRELVQKCQIKEIVNINIQSFDLTPGGIASRGTGEVINKGLYYSPSQTRKPSQTSEGDDILVSKIYHLQGVRDAFKGYFEYIENYIEDLKKVFPTLGDDWGIYIPEVKYLSPEPLVDYKNLSLTEYPNVYFVGDVLSARGITVAGSQGIYAAESILK